MVAAGDFQSSIYFTWGFNFSIPIAYLNNKYRAIQKMKYLDFDGKGGEKTILTKFNVPFGHE